MRTPGLTKSPRKFAGVVVAMCGLPGRGKSQVAQCLARRLNWNGDSTKGEGKRFDFIASSILQQKSLSFELFHSVMYSSVSR